MICHTTNSKGAKMEDIEKREQLIKGYEGQIRYLQKRIQKNANNKAKKSTNKA